MKQDIHAFLEQYRSQQADDFLVVAAAAKTGFETAIPFRAAGRFIAVQALDRKGDVLGVSSTFELKR